MKFNLSQRTITVLSICIFILLAITIFKSVKKSIIQDKYYTGLVKLGLVNQCYDPSTYFLEVFAQEGFDYDLENREVINESLGMLFDKHIQADEISRIPTITHRVYFTSEKTPVTLAPFYIEEMRLNFTNLNNLGGEWQHNVWVNDPNLVPADIRAIKGVKVRDVTEFKEHPLYGKLTNLIKKGNDMRPFLAEASDLFRLMALQKFGGIYADMDYEIYKPAALFELMKKFDFIGGREHLAAHSYYGNAFMAAKPNHPILNEALKNGLRNYVLDLNDLSTPKYIKYPCQAYDNLYFNGPPLITIAYFAKNNIDANRDIILPPWMIYNANFARYKNGNCKIAKISQEKFYRKNTNLTKLLEDFTINPYLQGALIGEATATNNNEYYQAHFQENSSANGDNIYYSVAQRNKFDIIGADMFCGSWTVGNVFKKNYYWTLFSANKK